MELGTERQRRPRNRPQKTTGVLVRTDHDARGIAEPLERYGELLACQVVGLYNAIHDLPTSSMHALARLKQLFHEAEGLPGTGKILIRPDYQWRYGYNHQTIYRRAPGTARFLHAKGIYTPEMMRWANATRIVQISENSRQEPSDHDAGLALLMSSIEIGVRRTPGLLFISHLEIIKNTSLDAQSAPNPLSVPFPALEHTFAGGKHGALTDVHVNPDALFGISYPPAHDRDYKFYALEYDRSTEDVEPTKSLLRSSWLRKILSYSAISAGQDPIYRQYLRIPNLLVLCVLSDPTRLANVMRLVRRRATDPAQFLFKVLPPVDPLLSAAPLPQLLHEPWQWVGGNFNICTLREGR